MRSGTTISRDPPLPSLQEKQPSSFLEQSQIDYIQHCVYQMSDGDDRHKYELFELIQMIEEARKLVLDNKCFARLVVKHIKEDESFIKKDQRAAHF